MSDLSLHCGLSSLAPSTAGLALSFSSLLAYPSSIRMHLDTGFWAVVHHSFGQRLALPATFSGEGEIQTERSPCSAGPSGVSRSIVSHGEKGGSLWLREFIVLTCRWKSVQQDNIGESTQDLCIFPPEEVTCPVSCLQYVEVDTAWNCVMGDFVSATRCPDIWSTSILCVPVRELMLSFESIDSI